ncbi:MAG: hypothetical protein DCC71_14845 [Proteobacteria bacterium]|nr:MAG: hypothetical protein DCC71_14845 [Pseudomonadota bacterium]
MTAALLALCVAPDATALPPAERSWEIQLSMYGWLAGLNADIEAGDVETEIDASFRDILKDLGWAVFGGLEARYERFVLLTDAMGMQLVTDESGSPRTRSFQRFANGPGGDVRFGEYDVHSRLTTWMLDVKPGLRVLSHPIGGLFGGAEQADDPRRLDVDLLAGFRYWNVTNKTGVEIEPASLTVGGQPAALPGLVADRIDIDGKVNVPGAFLRGVDRAKQDTVDWLDPLVGLRVTADVTQRWSVFALGDVGGWGVANASDLTWQAMLGSQLQLSEHWALRAGYRALGVNRDTAFDDGILHGPQIGAVFRF